MKTAQFKLTNARAESTFDLQREYASSGGVVARHGFYRAVLTWSGRSTDVKIGRQRIPPGTGFF